MFTFNKTHDLQISTHIIIFRTLKLCAFYLKKIINVVNIQKISFSAFTIMLNVPILMFIASYKALYVTTQERLIINLRGFILESFHVTLFPTRYIL